MFTQERGLGRFVIVALPLAAVLGLTSVPAPAEERARSMKISVSRVLFGEMPDQVVLATMEPLGQIMSKATGMTGSVVIADDGADLADKLGSNAIDVGVFDGIEFAWAQQKHKDFKPLMITVNTQKSVRAFVVTRAKGGIKGFADLKGKKLALPRNARPHCGMFLEQQCRRCGAKECRHFLGSIKEMGTAEEALDDLIDGKLDAVLIDNAALACFERRKPARAKLVHALVQSVEFPSAVVACRARTMDADTVARVQEALGSLDDSALGRQLLTFWQLSSFEPVPNNLNAVLARVATEYPAPHGYGR